MNKSYLTCFLALILVATGFSQEVILKGKITDSNNIALPFVNIGIPKKNTGTVSNENGEYKLKIPSNSSSLNDLPSMGLILVLKDSD